MNVARVIKLKEGEQVLRVVRNFWLIHLPAIALSAVLIAAPFFTMMPLFSAGRWGVGVFVVSVCVGLLYAARLLIIWYWNAFVITTSRVVDIDQRGFFSRTVSEATYDKIQDVSYAVRGMWGTLFRFGNIDLQTAGATANLELRGVRDPKDVHHLITEALQRFQAAANGGSRGEKVAALLEAASELNDAEARAFLVALKTAVDGAKGEPETEEKLDWNVRKLMIEDDEDPPPEPPPHAMIR